MWLCFLALAAAQINPQALYERGQRDATLSAQSFERLLKVAPESAYVLALLGDVKTQERQYTAALYAYNEAAKRLPRLRGVHFKSAGIYDSLGKSTEAAAARGRTEVGTFELRQRKTAV
jgi:predicted Zn-dependent protease